MNRKGFTLVELMVTIVIIGVLANIAVSRINGFITKARCTEVVVTLSTFERLQTIYMGINQRVGSLNEIGMDTPKSTFFEYNGEVEEFMERADGGGKTSAAKPDKKEEGSRRTEVCHMTGNAGCHTIEVDISGWENGLAPQGDALGACDETCNGMLIKRFKASLHAISKTYLTLYCRDGDGVYSEFEDGKPMIRGNTNGGNCGMYMGAWFRQ